MATDRSDVASRVLYLTKTVMYFLKARENPATKKCVEDIQRLISESKNREHIRIMEKILAGNGTRKDWHKMLLIAPLNSQLLTLAFIVCKWGISSGEHEIFLAFCNFEKLAESIMKEAFTKPQQWIEEQLAELDKSPSAAA